MWPCSASSSASPQSASAQPGSVDERLAIARVRLLEPAELDEHVRVVREAHGAAELVRGATQMRLGLGGTRPGHEQHAEIGARLGGHVGVVQRAPVVLLGVVDRAERPGQLGVAEQHGAGGTAHERREEQPRSLRQPPLPAAELGVEPRRVLAQRIERERPPQVAFRLVEPPELGERPGESDMAPDLAVVTGERPTPPGLGIHVVAGRVVRARERGVAGVHAPLRLCRAHAATASVDSRNPSMTERSSGSAAENDPSPAVPVSEYPMPFATRTPAAARSAGASPS